MPALACTNEWRARCTVAWPNSSGVTTWHETLPGSSPSGAERRAETRAQGFDLDPLRAVRSRPAALRLAVTAALEHYTATLVQPSFSPHRLEGVHEPMRKLLVWHATEELEQRTVCAQPVRAIFCARSASSSARWRCSSGSSSGCACSSARATSRAKGSAPTHARRERCSEAFGWSALCSPTCVRVRTFTLARRVRWI